MDVKKCRLSHESNKILISFYLTHILLLSLCTIALCIFNIVLGNDVLLKILLWHDGGGKFHCPDWRQSSSCSPNILNPGSQANLTISPNCLPTPIINVFWGESIVGHQTPKIEYLIHIHNEIAMSELFIDDFRVLPIPPIDF